MNYTTERFSRRTGEKVPCAIYAGCVYRFKRPLRIVDRLGYFAGIALMAGALSMAWWH